MVNPSDDEGLVRENPSLLVHHYSSWLAGLLGNGSLGIDGCLFTNRFALISDSLFALYPLLFAFWLPNPHTFVYLLV